MPLKPLYYFLRPIIPRPLQLILRRRLILRKRSLYSHIWPIDPAACAPPEEWIGWPEKKQFALVLQHDVDTQRGHDKCRCLMDLEESCGFRSSFNFVPERYNVSESLRNEITSRGFEVCVHGLKHDGKLFSSKRVFQKRAISINRYLMEWNSLGFTSPSMHHNLDWMHELNIAYDTSTFDTDPFEPQPDSARSIFPFLVYKRLDGSTASNAPGFNDFKHPSFYVELPYTLPQDHCIFIIMKEKTIDIWKQKLDWIAEKGGMALLNTHPDYMNFVSRKFSFEEYPAQYYKGFLEYIKSKYYGQYWHALPSQIAHFWRENMVVILTQRHKASKKNYLKTNILSPPKIGIDTLISGLKVRF